MHMVIIVQTHYLWTEQEDEKGEICVQMHT